MAPPLADVGLIFLLVFVFVFVFSSAPLAFVDAEMSGFLTDPRSENINSSSAEKRIRVLCQQRITLTIDRFRYHLVVLHHSVHLIGRLSFLL